MHMTTWRWGVVGLALTELRREDNLPTFLTIHEMWGDANLFMGFTQCCGPDVLVVLFHAPARKADLPCMMLEVGCALRKQH